MCVVPVTDGYLAFIMDRLQPSGPVTAKRMFGGAGLYCEGLFFGLIADDRLYFKTDGTNRGDYEAAGTGPFRPYGTYAMSFHEVPAEVVEDDAALGRWMQGALGAASRKAAARRPGKKK